MMLACAALAVGIAEAEEKTSSFTVDVPAGKWKGAQFRGLAGGGKLSVDVVASGPVEILLFDIPSYRQFPAIEKPMFRGSTEEKFGFSLIVPQSGDYILVLDNRLGAKPRRLNVTVTAATPPDSTERRRSYDLNSVNAMLAGVAETVGSVFAVESLRLSTERCAGKSVPPPSTGTIIVCVEYAERVLDGIDDRTNASAAMLYTLFHDIAVALAARSRTIGTTDPDRLDELATVLMRMFGQEGIARTQALYFASLSSKPALASALSKDPENPMSVRRARRILGWLDDPGLVRRWQARLVPMMQTAFLKDLQARPRDWTATGLVDRELVARQDQRI